MNGNLECASSVQVGMLSLSDLQRGPCDMDKGPLRGELHTVGRDLRDSKWYIKFQFPQGLMYIS